MALSGRITRYSKVPVSSGGTLRLLDIEGKGILKGFGVNLNFLNIKITIDGQPVSLEGDNINAVFGVTNVTSGGSGIWAQTSGTSLLQLSSNLPFTNSLVVEANNPQAGSYDFSGIFLWAVEV